MRLLLDTHVLLWALAEPDELSTSARRAIADGGNDVAVSAASLWEIAIKYALGKLQLPEVPSAWLPPALEQLGVEVLPIGATHALEVEALPALHRDPFDRMIVAQARIDGFTVVTRDPAVMAYGVATLGA